jgi:hypothetical protein
LFGGRSSLHKLFVTVTLKEYAQKQLHELTKTGANASITAFNQAFRLIAGRTGLGNKMLILFYEECIGVKGQCLYCEAPWDCHSRGE